MTVQEAKEVLNNIWDFTDAQDEEKADVVDDAIIEAIECMEEVEQYRAFKEIFESQFSSEALKLLNDKEEFTRWLERGKWNARKCDELNKELEQYRALGTVEGFQKALDSSLEYYIQMKEYKAKLQEYEAIGTVEELKEAREKQVAKKVQKLESKMLIADGWQYQCPKCKCAVGINQHAEEQTQEDEYCPTCGQALKWGGVDEV